MGQAAAAAPATPVAWLLRFSIWATLLLVPCWALMSRYQAGLARAAEWTFRNVFGMSVDVAIVQVYAPLDLGLFLSLCLAGRGLGRPLPLRRISLGVALLVALEFGTAMVILSDELKLLGDSPAVSVIRRAGVETLLFGGSILAWLVLSVPPAPGRRGRRH